MAGMMTQLTTHTTYAGGFTTQPNEIDIDALPIQGEIPRWLSGVLLRNGPAQFEVGSMSYRHWFDGLAMLHSFRFAEGGVAYKNRYLRTDAYLKDNATGKINYRGFAVDPCRTLFKDVMTLLAPLPKDSRGPNANVNITRLEGEFIAMTEIPIPVAFDAQTLATRGIAHYKGDNIAGQVTTAHPHYDARRKLGYNYMTHVGLGFHYNFYSLRGRKRSLVASLPVAKPGYMHSFGMSERYLILSEFSFRLQGALPLAFGDQPFIKNFEWQPDSDSVFYVVDKETGALVATATADPFFAFHHINAYDVEGAVVVDLCAYDDPSVIDEAFLEHVRADDAPAPGSGEFRRYTVPLNGGRATYTTIPDLRFELPRIYYERYNMQPYRYVYGVGAAPDGGFLDHLVKVDVESGSVLRWGETGCYAGEPVFVPTPDGTAEDDGVILSVILDARAQTSFLLVVDARDMREIGRACVPQHIPFGFHGGFYREA
jgi:beta,beta-carotene 9',10'-dioxygenase